MQRLGVEQAVQLEALSLAGRQGGGASLQRHGDREADDQFGGPLGRHGGGADILQFHGDVAGLARPIDRLLCGDAHGDGRQPLDMDADRQQPERRALRLGQRPLGVGVLQLEILAGRVLAKPGSAGAWLHVALGLANFQRALAQQAFGLAAFLDAPGEDDEDPLARPHGEVQGKIDKLIARGELDRGDGAAGVAGPQADLDEPQRQGSEGRAGERGVQPVAAGFERGFALGLEDLSGFALGQAGDHAGLRLAALGDQRLGRRGVEHGNGPAGGLTGRPAGTGQNQD